MQRFLVILLSLLSVICVAEEQKIHIFPEGLKQSRFISRIIQDKRGLLYFAGEKGVLEYDGITWLPIPMPGNRGPLAFALDNEGVLYLGGNGYIGYLIPDNDGKMFFYSLNDLIERNYQNKLNELFDIKSCDDNIFFALEKTLLVYDKKTITSIPTVGFINSLFCSNRSLFVVDSEQGLMRLRNKDLTIIKNGNFFRSQALTVLDNGEVLVATHNNGIIHLDLSKEKIDFTSLPEQDYALFKDIVISGIIPYRDQLLLGTTNHSLITLSNKGALLETKTELKEKIGKRIFAMYLDREQHLWFSSDQNISLLMFNDKTAMEQIQKKVNAKEKFVALFRSLVSTKDNVEIYGGAFFDTPGGPQRLFASKFNYKEITYRQNALRFSYSSNNIGLAEDIVYQSYLEGFDQNWSDWSKRNFREFTNLYWKEYHFKLKARMPDGTVSEEIDFHFRILPPWFETIWFYLAQVATWILLMITVVIIRIKKGNKKLESKINGVISGTFFSYFFGKLGVAGTIAAISGGAAFISVLMNSFMGIFLKPIQEKVGAWVVKIEEYMEKYFRKSWF